MRTVGHAFGLGRNCFDLMRLVAASLVIYSHSYALIGSGVEDPIRNQIWGYGDVGLIAVSLFFVLSGFLVARSIQVHSVGNYVLARVARIMPAFIVLILVQTFVMGPLVTTFSPRAYFTSADTWAALKSFRVWGIEYSLPGVFQSHPIKAVNGSLWTLPGELAFYLFLPFFFLAGVLNRGWIFLVVAVVFIAAYLPSLFGITPAIAQEGVVFGVSIATGSKWALSFLGGVVLWVFRERVPVSGGLALASFVLLFAAQHHIAGPLVYTFAFPYLVLYLGLAFPFGQSWTAKVGDWSYGTYLYGFPVQQTLIHLGVTQIWLLTTLAVPIALALGAVSWWLVEKPALRVKSRISGHREAAVRVRAEIEGTL